MCHLSCDLRGSWQRSCVLTAAILILNYREKWPLHLTAAVCPADANHCHPVLSSVACGYLKSVIASYQVLAVSILEPFCKFHVAKVYHGSVVLRVCLQLSPSSDPVSASRNSRKKKLNPELASVFGFEKSGFAPKSVANIWMCVFVLSNSVCFPFC